MTTFAKAHPATQAMSAARAPVDLNEGDTRRNPGEPSAEQAEASSYNKPKIQWHGLTICVENPAGSVRRGRNRHGVTWEVRMRFDYGEVLGTMGVDGDPVDVIVGPNMEAPMVYVVHQRRVNDWAAYDEDKCCIGFDSQSDAEQAFLSNYNDPRFLGPVTAMPVAEFVAKVRATKDKPAMIKAVAPVVLFFKAHVGAYLRGGKMVNLSGYQGRQARAVDMPGQMSLFGSNEHVSTPRAEMIAEHERLVDVLNSPSHEDDKVEAKRQEKELAEYKQEAAPKRRDSSGGIDVGAVVRFKDRKGNELAGKVDGVDDMGILEITVTETHNKSSIEVGRKILRSPDSVISSEERHAADDSDRDDSQKLKNDDYVDSSGVLRSKSGYAVVKIGRKAYAVTPYENAKWVIRDRQKALMLRADDGGRLLFDSEADAIRYVSTAGSTPMTKAIVFLRRPGA